MRKKRWFDECGLATMLRGVNSTSGDSECSLMTMAGGATNEALRERVTCLENFIGVPEDDEAVSLSVSTEQHAIELVDLRKILDDFMTKTNARLNNIMEDVMSLTDVVKSTSRVWRMM
ncbi:hypothetical protein F0562_025853 [Nyssa sinensis]|uniref:Uncharacterized protein n=1 Tax=Nyssa sinensis TaxID=561372 RepID=A0A5J5BD73_9ASTE|nr:hypothetical protein F0562_025853 [Nyssa sinensis]